MFDVAGSFVGITEIKAALKGGNLVAILGQTLKKIPKDAVKIVTSTQKITTKTAKEIAEGVKSIVKNGKFIDEEEFIKLSKGIRYLNGPLLPEKIN